jgi:glucosamine--fructose-6-phosphate aminotransferase (isomerizing)
MCGIFGNITTNNTKSSMESTIQGLKHLEYRGYDSTGLAAFENGVVEVIRTCGRVSDLESLCLNSKKDFTCTIGHTRWATHGQPSEKNAHPHLDKKKTLALVHNGIIENFLEIKEFLKEKEIECVSETDSEVIAQLIAFYYSGNLIETLCHITPLLHGSWAIAILHKDYPDQIIALAKESPLAIALDEETSTLFLSSDVNAIQRKKLKIYYLENNEIALLKKNQVEVFDEKGTLKEVSFTLSSFDVESCSKGNYEHFMLKEIFEQPTTIRKALEGRINEFLGTSFFDELCLSTEALASIQNVVLVGCGTSYHAASIGAMMIEEFARIPAKAEIASEFRYADPIIDKQTLVIAISQSGETADTLAAAEEVKKKGALLLGICNVVNSKLNRISDSTIFLKAGPEISVCSTKAFTSQITILALLGIYLARLHKMSIDEGVSLLQEIKKLPFKIEKILQNAHVIEKAAISYSDFKNYIFIGRRYMHTTSLEAALKLKEISYLNASAYAAGELKHGPIALIDGEVAIIALFGNHLTNGKLISNIMEIKARKGVVISIASEKSEELERCCDHLIYIPSSIDSLNPILHSIVCQLFAYYIAKQKNTDIDKPRNLAKSVTVE